MQDLALVNLAADPWGGIFDRRQWHPMWQCTDTSDSLSEETLDRIRERLSCMSDAELEKWGRSAAYMCTPEAHLGKPPRHSYVQQLELGLATPSPSASYTQYPA